MSPRKKDYVSICWYPVFPLTSKRDDVKRRFKGSRAERFPANAVINERVLILGLLLASRRHDADLHAYGPGERA